MGSSKLLRKFKIDPEWKIESRHIKLGDIPAIVCDKKDNLYIANRGQVPIIVFRPDGKFKRHFGSKNMTDLHGLTVDRKNDVWCVDRNGCAVKNFSSKGRLKKNIHSKMKTANLGDLFRGPTGVAVNSKGDLFISDGYANARIHHFSATGRYIKSWGSFGQKLGQFRLPHGIAIDLKDRIYVCDRENNRIQVFNDRGRLLRIIKNLKRPSHLCFDLRGQIYIAEMGYRVSVLNARGKKIGQIGNGKSGINSGRFLTAPHGVAVDSNGCVYVSEVHMGETVPKVEKRKGRIHKFIPQK